MTAIAIKLEKQANEDKIRLNHSYTYIYRKKSAKLMIVFKFLNIFLFVRNHQESAET